MNETEMSPTFDCYILAKDSPSVIPDAEVYRKTNISRMVDVLVRIQ